MEEDFNIKSFFKICLSCGLGVLGLVIVYNLGIIFFNFIYENWNKISSFFSIVLFNPLGYIKEFIFKNLDFFNKAWFLSILWISCIIYKVAKNYDDYIPLFLERIFYFIAFIGAVLCIYNFIETNFGYVAFTLCIIFYNMIFIDSKKRRNSWIENYDNPKQLEFEFKFNNKD